MGTVAEWKATSVETNNQHLLSATAYGYSETTPPLNRTEDDYDGKYWHYVNGVVTIWVYVPKVEKE